MKNSIDFSKVLEKNHKKMQNTPVSDLLRSTTTEVVDSFTPQSNLKEVELKQQLFKMEGLIQSLIINQQTLANQMKLQIPQKGQDTQKKSISLFSVILIALIIGLMSYLAFITRKPLKEITPPQNISSEKSAKKYYINKYINLRDTFSSKSEIITVLPPNAIIKVLRKNNDWTKIQYFNHVESKYYEGWIWGSAYKEVFSEARLKP